MVISSGQSIMYNTHPSAHPSMRQLCHFLTISPPHHSSFLRLPASAPYLQITAALVIRPVISCNSFFPSSLPVGWKGTESERFEEVGRDSRSGNTHTHRHTQKKKTDDRESGGKRRRDFVRRREEYGDETEKRVILRHREKKCARVKDCKILDFLLIIPPLLRFNYSPSELSVRLQVWPCAERPLHPITQFDLLTFHLFSNHDMTFQVCQV